MSSAPFPNPGAAPHHGVFADLYTFNWSAVSVRTALVGSLAVAVSVIGGVLIGHPAAGLITGGGAMTIGCGLNQRIADSRLWPMITATLAMTLSTFVGMLAGHRGYGVVVAGGIWAFGYGLLTARAAGIAWVGQQAALTLLVTSAFPTDARHAFYRAMLTLLGGVLQIGITSLMLQILPELRADLRTLSAFTWQETVALRRTLHPLRVARRLRGVPRVIPLLQDSAALGFAIRMTITVLLATELYRWRGVQSGYWIPMTAMLVQKPAFAETLNRALLRVAGTLAGAGLTTLALMHMHPQPIVLALLATLFTFAAYLTLPVNYGLYSVALTSYIVFLLSLNTLPGPEIAARRAYATAAGGVIALVIHLDALRRHRQAVRAGQDPTADAAHA